MSSINGCINFHDTKSVSRERVQEGGRLLSHRGPDSFGMHRADGVCFYHNRLAVRDPVGGKQPMSAVFHGRRYTIVYNGEIYNSRELRLALSRQGAVFATACDTETVLWAYIFYGEDAPRHLNGTFAFAVHDACAEKVVLARDRFGIKPLYYAYQKGNFYFASEQKALLDEDIAPPEIDAQGLWQLLYLAPVTLPGQSVFKHIREVLPGHVMTVDATGMRERPYWELKAAVCGDDIETAAAHVRELLSDAVARQLESDVPLAVLLSGGLDSSAVTALAARALEKCGAVLDTYSFEYEGNREHFTASLFQPEGDDAYAAMLAGQLGTHHTVLTATSAGIAERLYTATYARDLPGQADIDSSLLYYCEEIKKRHTVVLSGEGSDEIFGGYPWFYRPEMLYREFFPWAHEPRARISLFDDVLVQADRGYEYMCEVYRGALAACPVVEGEPDEDRRARQATWLSTQYFMANLLERKDRMSMYGGVEARVPFGDHRILEYVFNLPWAYKHENGVEKSLLRRAMEGILPSRVLWRKKSPYPKTHDPLYEELVAGMLAERLAKPGGFLREAVDQRRLDALLAGEGGTWFGQLMAKPQLLAWLCQLDFWFERYRVRLV